VLTGVWAAVRCPCHSVLRGCCVQVVPDEFDRQLVELKRDTLLKLVHAANFFDIPPLLDLACAKVASLIKDKTAVELQRNFPIIGECRTCLCIGGCAELRLTCPDIGAAVAWCTWTVCCWTLLQ
jgi:hypothetical protein